MRSPTTMSLYLHRPANAQLARRRSAWRARAHGRRLRRPAGRPRFSGDKRGLAMPNAQGKPPVAGRRGRNRHTESRESPRANAECCWMATQSTPRSSSKGRWHIANARCYYLRLCRRTSKQGRAYVGSLRRHPDRSWHDRLCVRRQTVRVGRIPAGLCKGKGHGKVCQATLTGDYWGFLHGLGRYLLPRPSWRP